MRTDRPAGGRRAIGARVAFEHGAEALRIMERPEAIGNIVAGLR
jgi:hypothetical protein